MTHRSRQPRPPGSVPRPVQHWHRPDSVAHQSQRWGPLRPHPESLQSCSSSWSCHAFPPRQSQSGIASALPAFPPEARPVSAAPRPQDALDCARAPRLTPPTRPPVRRVLLDAQYERSHQASAAFQSPHSPPDLSPLRCSPNQPAPRRYHSCRHRQCRP